MSEEFGTEAESHQASLSGYIEQLKLEYQEMHPNATKPVYYDAPLTPMDALRMITRSRPAIIKQCNILTSKGKEKEWNLPQTYIDTMADEKVSIAITENGLADSVIKLKGGEEEVFVKPLNEELSFPDFLDRLGDKETKEIVYLQSQDGNIYRTPPRPGSEPQLRKMQDLVEPEIEWMRDALEHLSSMQDLVEPEIEWMRDALGNGAEAVNLWVGNNRSVTSFHHDPFENIYHVLSGSKTFCLVSPIEGLFFDQQFYPQYTLHRDPSGAIQPIRDPEPTHDVPWVDSLLPPPGSKAVDVVVNAGETLYLPSGWWHRVSQSPGEGGLAVAVNYWYPSEPDAQISVYERLSRRIAREAGMEGVIPVPGDEDGSELDAIWGDDDQGSGSGEEWDPKEWGR